MPDPLSETQWTIVQKILSCIYRMKGAHALARVVETLLGAKTGYITENALDRLSTYALLTGYDPDELKLVILALVRAGCATLSDDGEDLIALTPKGIRVAKKEESNFTLLWPRRAIATPVSTARRIAFERTCASRREPPSRARPPRPLPITATTPDDIALASELRSWRKGVADDLGIPAFRIMTNKTLDALVQDRPTTLAALSHIYGIYRQTREDYGEDILDIIREHE